MKKMFLVLLNFICALRIFSLTPEQEAAGEQDMNSLSDEVIVSQIFLVNIEGTKKYSAVETLSDIKSSLPDAPLVPGGCLFFSFNISSSEEELISFISSIKEYGIKNGFPAPYCAVDQEGGYVIRLKEITSPLPSCRRVAETLKPSEAAVLYGLQSEQMRALGFTLNLAPVCEALNEENASFLESRSFGGIPETIAYSSAAIFESQKRGVFCAVKHFPGNTGTDPHTGLPEIKLSSQLLKQRYVFPFRMILNVEPLAVIMSHVRTSCIDSSNPSCLSKVWISDILKNELKFSGLVISDDIFMAALEKNGFPPDVACVKAVEAGVDVIMLSEKRFADSARCLLEKSSCDEVFKKELCRAEKNVILFKLKAGLLSFKKNAEGILFVSDCSLEKTDKERLSEFKEARSLGLDFYRKHF